MSAVTNPAVLKEILASLDGEGLRKLCARSGLSRGGTKAERVRHLVKAYRGDLDALLADARRADLIAALQVTFETPHGDMELGGLWKATRAELLVAVRAVYAEGWEPKRDDDSPAPGSPIAAYRYWDDYSDALPADAPDEAFEEPADEERSYPSYEIIDARTSPGPDARNDSQLETFQTEAVEALDSFFAKRAGRRGLLCLPTGGGKTRTSLDWLLRRFVAKGQRVLWVTHRLDLLDQVHEELRGLAWLLRDSGRPTFAVSRYQGVDQDLRGDVVLASAMSIARRRPTHAKLCSADRRLGIICYDEAHRAIATGTWTALQRIMEPHKVPLLGLTATPFRTEKGGTARLRACLGEPIYQRSFNDLVRIGFLARPSFQRQRLHSTDSFTLSEEERRDCQTELTPSVLSRLAKHPRRNEEIVAHWVAGRQRFGKTLVFACNTDHADKLSATFARAGVRAGSLHSRMDPTARRHGLEAFRGGRLDVLVNVGILTEGANIPDTRTILLARPTLSESLYLQMIGRGARGERAVPGKKDFVVIDCVDNFDRHGLRLAGVEAAKDLLEAPDKLGADQRGEASSTNASRRARAAALMAAWLATLGFDPKQYTFWGELLWRARDGSERAVVVFVEGVQILAAAVTMAADAVESHDWRAVHAQSDPLDRAGACRRRDWKDMIADCEVTLSAPRLVHVPEFQISETIAATGQRIAALVRTAQEQGSLAGSAACDAAWAGDDRLRDLFPTATALRQHVDGLVTDLRTSALAGQAADATTREGLVRDWSAVSALVVLGDAVARADGVVLDSEILAIRKAAEQVFEIEDAADTTKLHQIMTAIGEAADPSAAAATLSRLLPWGARLTAFDWLFRVALADGQVTDDEVEVLRRFAAALEIPVGHVDERLRWYEDVGEPTVVTVTDQFRACATCNATWPLGTAFCGECGTSLEARSPEGAPIADASGDSVRGDPDASLQSVSVSPMPVAPESDVTVIEPFPLRRVSAPAAVLSAAGAADPLRDSRGRPPPPTAPDALAGFAAEEWLERELRRLFGRGVHRHHRDEHNRETDFRVELLLGEMVHELHIELKHLADASDCIYWSLNEVRKAEHLTAQRIPYFLAIARHREDRGGYDLYWSRNPLMHFAGAQRDLEWEWVARAKVSSTAWEATPPMEPVVDARPSGKFRIRLDASVLGALEFCPVDDDPLQPVRQWASVRTR